MNYSLPNQATPGRLCLLCILLPAGFLASTISARAQTRVDSDNFNTAPLSTTWWGTVESTPLFHPNITLSLDLDAAPTHLSLTGSGSGLAGAQMQVPRNWDPTALVRMAWSDPLDFSVTVRAHNAFTPTSENQYASIGLTMSSASGAMNENLNL